MSREDGLENAVKGLKRILPHAEKRNVVIFMELLKSKVDHPDYMADNSAWAIELCKRLGSKHFSLLYDIYHMQINEGDIIRTIRDNYQYFGHYHTAGVPGRHEIDASQELNYEAIAKAIVETGFKGYLAQEFIPTPKTKAAASGVTLFAVTTHYTIATHHQSPVPRMYCQSAPVSLCPCNNM